MLMVVIFHVLIVTANSTQLLEADSPNQAINPCPEYSLMLLIKHQLSVDYAHKRPSAGQSLNHSRYITIMLQEKNKRN